MVANAVELPVFRVENVFNTDKVAVNVVAEEFIVLDGLDPFSIVAALCRTNSRPSNNSSNSRKCLDVKTAQGSILVDKASETINPDF